MFGHQAFQQEMGPGVVEPNEPIDPLSIVSDYMRYFIYNSVLSVGSNEHVIRRQCDALDLHQRLSRCRSATDSG